MGKEVSYLFCDHCNALVKESNYLAHLKQVHEVKTLPREEYIKNKLINDKAEVEKWKNDVNIRRDNKPKTKKKKKKKNRDQNISISNINQELRRKNRIQYDILLRTIDLKYSSYSKELSDIQNSLYNEDIERLTQGLIERLEIEKQKINDKREVSKINEYLLQFSAILENKRTRRDDFLSNECKTFYITWSDVTFDKNKVHISPDRAFVKPIEFLGSMESLNIIKKDYFNRVYPKSIYKLTFYKGSLEKDLSRDYEKFSDAIELAKEYFQFKFNITQTSLFKGFEKMSHDQLTDLYSKYFERSDYLKFLAKNQSKEYKIIPIIEYINGLMEESFLFRINIKNKEVMIIWENTNEGRATYVFHSKISEMDKSLRGIESFIINQIHNKRSFIRSRTIESRTLQKQLNLVSTFKHTTIDDFKYNFHEVKDLISSL